MGKDRERKKSVEIGRKGEIEHGAVGELEKKRVRTPKKIQRELRELVCEKRQRKVNSVHFSRLFFLYRFV